MSHAPRKTARLLGAAFAAGPLELDSLVERGEQLLGRRPRWLRPLARRVEAAFAGAPRPRVDRVAQFLLADERFQLATGKLDAAQLQRSAIQHAMAPIRSASSWRVAPLSTPGQLAAWLGVTPRELSWFADVRCFERKHCRGPLRHYCYRRLDKRFGKTRLIEAPKPRLKEIQRQLLGGILDRVPAHDAAHGFRLGRSVRTFAEVHARHEVVLKLDLEDFFPTVAAAQVATLFRSIGYPEAVADLLTGLSTNSAPADVWDGAHDSGTVRARRQRRLYAQPHLPQGAPTSPALANLCAYRLDCRLAGLANAAGGVYARYADDLAFSGDAEFARSVRRFQTHACAIALEEGYAVNHHKTRVMRRSQQQRIAGLVVNERPAVSRAERDRLKAILTNCVRHGPESQNRDGHADFRACLNGSVSWVEMVCPEQGAKLRRVFDRIVW